MNPPVDAPASRQSRSRGSTARTDPGRPELLSPARDVSPCRPITCTGVVGHHARRPSWPGSRDRHASSATAACARPGCSPAPAHELDIEPRRRARGRSLGCSRRRLRGGLLRRVGLLGRRLRAVDFLPDVRRPDAVMPARRSRSRTRFFTASGRPASRRHRVHPEETSRETNSFRRSRLRCDQTSMSAAS